MNNHKQSSIQDKVASYLIVYLLALALLHPCPCPRPFCQPDTNDIGLTPLTAPGSPDCRRFLNFFPLSRPPLQQPFLVIRKTLSIDNSFHLPTPPNTTPSTVLYPVQDLSRSVVFSGTSSLCDNPPNCQCSRFDVRALCQTLLHSKSPRQPQPFEGPKIGGRALFVSTNLAHLRFVSHSDTFCLSCLFLLHHRTARV